VNVNNQAYPVIGVATTSAQSRPPVSASTHVNSSLSYPNTASVFASTSHASSAAATRAILQSTQSGSSQPRPSAVIASVTVSQNTPVLTYNLQSPTQSFVSNVPRLPVTTTPHIPVTAAPNVSVQAPKTVVPGAPPSSASSSYVFQVNAVQIRLGTKKFKPLTAVTFKDDGVLFTLSGM